jgi:signal transduction histidine kinase
MKILIVDDKPVNLKLLRAQLEAEGHEVAEAVDGNEALEILEWEGADAIISDILMPRMDGYRLCHEVRKSEQFKNLPFIFYTATYTSPSDEKLCFDLGGDKYLRKPSSIEEILTALSEAADVAEQRVPKWIGSPSEFEVMKEYSERLVSKLEEKNVELQEALEKLHLANAEILELNRSLERRVGERTIELEAANKELEAFSYSISHDLRAPLRAVDGFSHVLLEECGPQLPEEACGYLKTIRGEVLRMGKLIDDLLAFSQLSRIPLKKQEVNTGKLVRRVLEELEPQQEGRQVEIRIADLPACQGDPALLSQVWVNLLSNALKYSRQRQPAAIEIGCKSEQDENLYFVRDNGAGFDMRYAHKLFGVFQRLHGADEFEGTGVGLAIVQRVVHRHGGRVWAEAEVDKGATFYFALPSIEHEDFESRINN